MSEETLLRDTPEPASHEAPPLPGFANLFGGDPDVMRNPYEFYKAASQEGPITREPHFGVYLATRYADILQLERRHDDFSACVASLGPYAVGKVPERPTASACPFGKSDLTSDLVEWRQTTPLSLIPVLTLDPPDHTEFRNVINRLFTPGRKEALTPRLRIFADELISDFIADGETEWVSRYAAPYTYFTMNEVMDFPRADEDALRARFRSLKNLPRRRGEVDGAMVRGAEEVDNPLAVSRDRMRQYLAERRADPKDDVLSIIATARLASGKLPDIEDLIGIAGVMYGAGQGTTKDLIANAMRILAINPDLQASLREKPDQIENFVAEVLRFDPPVQGLFRYCLRDTEVNGVKIPAGAVIWMVYAAANRDDAVFDNAEVFDPARTDAFKAVSFGNGRHFCPGQPLARLEAKTTFEEALRRMKNIRLKDESVAIPYHDWFVVHGPTELDIVFDPA